MSTIYQTETSARVTVVAMPQVGHVHLNLKADVGVSYTDLTPSDAREIARRLQDAADRAEGR